MWCSVGVCEMWIKGEPIPNVNAIDVLRWVLQQGELHSIQGARCQQSMVHGDWCSATSHSRVPVVWYVASIGAIKSTSALWYRLKKYMVWLCYGKVRWVWL